MASTPGKESIREVFGFFLRLGLTGFGGPAAHIALMKQETVERRQWLSREQFLNLVGGCNLLPGPSSTQVAMALGFVRRKWVGLVVAGACFILPGALLTLALAWAYIRYGHLPQVQGLLYGAKPVMVVIVSQAIWRLGRMALRGWPMTLLGFACFLSTLAGVSPVVVLLVAGGTVLLATSIRSHQATSPCIAWTWTSATSIGMTGLAAVQDLLRLR